MRVIGIIYLMKNILKMLLIITALFLFTGAAASQKSLKGMTICVDAGHGKTTRLFDGIKEPVAPGSEEMKAAIAAGTTGAVTRISEERLNLAVSLKLKKALAHKGAKVIMVRETHNCDLTNVERAKLWNASGAHLTIRIHANGSENSSVSGILMMVPGDKYVRDREMLKKSAQAGQYVMEGVLEHTGAVSRGTVKSTELTGFNWSEIPVILLEMGFMTNPEEDRLLNTGEYQDKIVQGIIEGVEKYKNHIDKNK